MGEPLEYSDIINTCNLNQRGAIAKHMLAYEVLQVPGWDIAFPDNPISHIDAIVFNHEYVYKFQVKHVNPYWRPSRKSRRYAVPLRNHVKYKYRKDQTLKDRSKAYKYFNHGIDCVYAYDSTSGWMTTGGMYVWSTTPHKTDLSVYTVSIDQPANQSKRRVYVPDLQGFTVTRKKHEIKKYTHTLLLGR
jgi:hypothetical protein|tara:strand:+ start:4580 stop:5146 length:567 start_codon:yes stop_codon:yes gene_type:complete